MSIYGPNLSNQKQTKVSKSIKINLYLTTFFLCMIKKNQTLTHQHKQPHFKELFTQSKQKEILVKFSKNTNFIIINIQK